MRRRQAKEAYKIAGKLDPTITYLLVDDVWTTGASMIEAGKKMREAGARRLVACVLASSR